MEDKTQILRQLTRLVQVRWHRSLEEVPSDVPVIVIAHEFFDALPVHQFQARARSST